MKNLHLTCSRITAWLADVGDAVTCKLTATSIVQAKLAADMPEVDVRRSFAVALRYLARAAERVGFDWLANYLSRAAVRLHFRRDLYRNVRWIP